MKRKIVWLVVSGLMVLSLVLASCAPAAAPEEEKEAPAPVTPTPAEKEKEAPVPEEKEAVAPAEKGPTYGGVLTLVAATSPIYFDEIVGAHSQAWPPYLTNEELLSADWAKGMRGEGLWGGVQPIFPGLTWQTGHLAESWELRDPETMVFHIRKGVYWHDKPPTNGREMTTDDILFSLWRNWGTPGYPGINYPYLKNMDDIEESIYSPEPWTVIIESQPGMTGMLFEMAVDFSMVVPRDAVEEYGNLNFWENVIGTGPFILTDYVSASSLTYQRNPNYWMNDPFEPQNQLPYLDTVKILIITDVSTRLAALRTAKIDRLAGVEWEDWDAMKKSNPEMLWSQYLPGSPPALHPRNDIEPFSDIRVRRALAMAINQQEIVDEYYNGAADILAWPILGNPEFADMYTPLEELPEAARELFEYHPDKARELLAEAGYPDGFKTSVLTYDNQNYIDTLSIIKDYWADIGVELELDVKEYGAYISQGRMKNHEQMYMFVTASSAVFKLVMSKPGNFYNYSMNEETLPNELFDRVGELYFDVEARNKFVKESYPEMIERAWFFPLPAPHYYTGWYPWLKGYNGENYAGYYNSYVWARYVWLDRDLKEEMTGKR